MIIIAIVLLSVSACSKPNHLFGIPIEMRDGINLYTDIYIPMGEGLAQYSWSAWYKIRPHFTAFLR